MISVAKRKVSGIGFFHIDVDANLNQIVYSVQKYNPLSNFVLLINTLVLRRYDIFSYD